MAAIGDNPFAALTLIAAPAILTNASSVLALGTSNRFARAVDRQRALSAMLDTGMMDEETGALRLRQLGFAQRRADLLLRGLTSFYLSLASFASAALVSLLGAVVVTAGGSLLAEVLRWIALATGFFGVGGLVAGCSLLVHETRVTLRSLREEASFTRSRYGARHPARATATHKEPPVV